MLLEELITEMATRLEDSSITSLEGLQNAGILNSTNMYVPDNFLLEKVLPLSYESVTFLPSLYGFGWTVWLSIPHKPTRCV